MGVVEIAPLSGSLDWARSTQTFRFMRVWGGAAAAVDGEVQPGAQLPPPQAMGQGRRHIQGQTFSAADAAAATDSSAAT